MTEKLLTGTLSLNTTNQPTYYLAQLAGRVNVALKYNEEVWEEYTYYYGVGTNNQLEA